MINRKLRNVIRNIEVIELTSWRYRVLFKDGKYYLADIEWNYLVYLFPFFYWWIPARIYEISEQQFKKIDMNDETKEIRENFTKKWEKDSGAWELGIGIGTSIVVFGVFDHFYLNVNATVRLIFVLLIFASFVFLRIRINRSEKIEMRRELQLVNPRKTKIVPETRKMVGDVLMEYLLILGGAILLGYDFVNGGEILSLLFYGFFLALTIIRHTEISNGKNNRYRVVFKEENV